MAEPSRRASRLSIAGAVLAALGAGAAGFVLGRGSVEPTRAPPTAAPPVSISPPAPAPVLPTVQPPLGRAELTALANKAADTLAAGRALPEQAAELAGREFELRLPFGCPGAGQATAGALSAEYDEQAETLRARAVPVRWPPEHWMPGGKDMPEGGTEIEGIEGFWIPRPWTSSEACPVAVAADAAAEAEQTLAIAQFFTSEGSRVGRRDGKAYEAVERVAPDALNLSRGLQLRLRGRLVRAPRGSQPILCRAPNATRPVCIISASFDEVAIHNPATDETLATWDVSSQSREPAER